MTTDATCGCAGSAPARPIDNRPGLSAIRYRVGSHSDFLRSMRAALSSGALPALAALRARGPEDFTIALCDAWAAACDVLTFYQERIASETYLRTATERRSILELARLIGFELDPGVAASTYLAFRLETAPGAPDRTRIPAATPVQSLPGPDQRPQTFETLAELEARGAWNEWRARTTRGQLLEPKATSAVVAGAPDLHVGDLLLFRYSGASEVHPVQSVVVEPGRAIVGWQGGLRNRADELHVFRQRASLFGHNAAEWRTMPDAFQRSYLGMAPADPKAPVDTPARKPTPSLSEWPDILMTALQDPPPRDPERGLLAAYFATPAMQGRGQLVVGSRPSIDVPAGGAPLAVRYSGWLQFPKTEIADYRLAVEVEGGVRLWLDGRLLLDAWTVQSARSQGKLEVPPVQLQGGVAYRFQVDYFQGPGQALLEVLWKRLDREGEYCPLSPSDLIAAQPEVLHLDGAFPRLASDGFLAVTTPDPDPDREPAVFRIEAVDADRRSRFGMAAATTRIRVDDEELVAQFDGAIRTATVWVESQPLVLSDVPDGEPVAGSSIELDGALADPPPRGREVIVAGTAAGSGAGDHGAEVAVVEAVETFAGRTRLILAEPLRGSYQRDGLRILGNVAFATHGETIAAEVLGSGDATRAQQRFALQRTPLTRTPAATVSGAASTLELRVDGVAWREVPTLHGRSPAEPVYQTRVDDEGRTAILFGDGREGARLPTGAGNVVARYRHGLGRDGNLAAGQLSLLMARPLGVRDVTNPLPARGGGDPESRDQARDRAPRSVVTLERVVSLRDYQDFAEGFGGIGKALVTASHDGAAGGRGIYLTVAGPGGGEVAPERQRGLIAALLAAGDAAVPIRVGSYRPVGFRLLAQLRVEAARRPDDVVAAVRLAVQDRFSFAHRGFGQPVARSEVIAAIQAVPGVVMVDIDLLDRPPSARTGRATSGPGFPGYRGFPDHLPSEAPRPLQEAATIEPAELLLAGELRLSVLS